MSTSPSVFPLAHIALTAAITAGVSLLVLVLLSRRFKTVPLPDCLLVALVAGLSVLLWRSAGNTGALNNDPLPAVSPNDVLCPLVTYVMLGVYGQLTGQIARPAWGRLRALLTITAFVVNVVTI